MILIFFNSLINMKKTLSYFKLKSNYAFCINSTKVVKV